MTVATLEAVEMIVSERTAVLERRIAPEALTVRDVAQRLRLSVSRVRELISHGELPSYRIGRARRVDPSALADFLAERQRVVPKPARRPRAAPAISSAAWLADLNRRIYGA